MKEFNKLIFGKKFKIQVSDFWFAEAKETFEPYDDFDAEDKSDVILLISDAAITPEAIKARNPKTFAKLEDGIYTDLGEVKVSWEQISGKLQISAEIQDPKLNTLKRRITRLRAIEYSSQAEWFEQRVFELLLIPSVYFMPDRALIHAAAVGNHNGALLFTGTGGVGKSSALLSATKDKDMGFVTDDIAVVDADGNVYGNMAWPKIYGYNCIDNDLESRILEGRGLLDRLQFKIKNKSNPTSVRRKLKPKQLFTKVFSNRISIKTVFILFRSDCEALTVCHESSKADFVNMTLAVIFAEYQIFNKFLEWDEYNSIARGLQPMMTLSQLRERWSTIFSKTFENSQLVRVDIPLEHPHKTYQSEIADLIKSFGSK